MSLTATRITDAANTLSADTGLPLPSIEAEYSTCSPFSADSRYILLKEFSYFCLYDVATRERKRPILFVDAPSEPRWSRFDPNVFYFHKGNTLYRYRVDVGFYEPVHTFMEYSSITAKGESEISEHEDALVLAGDGRDIFIFRITLLIKGPVLRVDAPWDSVCLTPFGNVALTKADGIHLYSRDMEYLRQLTRANGHKCFARDGNREILIWTNSAEPAPRKFEDHRVVAVDTLTAEQTPLIQIPWEFSSLHITALRDSCVVGTYNGRGGGSLWRVWFNGWPEWLLDHGSSADVDWKQPRPTASRNSRFVAYNSDKGGRVDVYLVDLSGVDTQPAVDTPSSDGLDLALPSIKGPRRGGFWSRVKGWFT